MKILFCILSFLMALNAFAVPEKIGVGVMLGNPTGLNGKYWLENDHAIDAGLGVSIGKHTNANLYSDYLLHKRDAFYFNDVHPLDLHFGLGARMEFADTIELGLRIPVGVTHRIVEKSADVFAEIAPVVDVIGKVGIELGVGIGARYYFR